ncbi:hypothetical protein V9T40_002695 [Parthenolecanium corni]|uniref:Uncharacterized protein n=1 Tax=Parthenolecanium corni TaxID=536013 RepID=A0AAN9TGM2_9HEMI
MIRYLRASNPNPLRESILRPYELSMAPNRNRFRMTSRPDASEENDPLNDARSTPSYGLAPLPGAKYLYTGAEGLSSLVELLHTLLVAKSPVFGKQVSESAFAYYAAVLAWKRMLEVHRANGFSVTDHERAFIDQVDCLSLRPPKALQTYLNSIGNCKVSQGREYQFRIFDRKYLAIGCWKGLFGVADHTTQHLYRAYPCLDIFGMRIQADLRDDVDKVWKLPKAAADPKSLHPTVNLLGWKPAARLSEARRDFLIQTGVTADSFHNENETLLFNPELLSAIQNVLNYPQMMQLSEMSKTSDGSLGQIAYLKCVGSEKRELANEVTQYSYTKISPNISQLAAALSFRVARPPGKEQNGTIRVNWCINQFEDDKVPAAYNEHCNDLRKAEPAILQFAEFAAVDSGFIAGLSRWIESFAL